MADNKWTQEQLYALLQYASRKMGVSPQELATALADGGVEKLADHLSPESTAKLQSMMGDRARAQTLLESPQAQALLKKLLGD